MKRILCEKNVLEPAFERISLFADVVEAMLFSEGNHVAKLFGGNLYIPVESD